ncbi:MAG: hypothetical protein RI958_384 [Actinomycetota bacterium]
MLVLSMTAGVWVDDGGLVEATARRDGAVVTLAPELPAPVTVTASETVTADPLPTVQIDGVAFAQAIVGDTVYVGGRFTSARPAGAPPGVDTVPRANVLAYRLETGELVTSFAPVFDGQVRVLSASPDGTRLYVGGDFTRVDGQTRRYLAAFDVATGSLLPFAPSVGYHVMAIAHSSTAVYIGGSFQSVGSRVRRNLAAFDRVSGALLPWAPEATGGLVAALAVSPDGSKVAVGGRFTALNGSSSPGFGLGAVDAVTGAARPWRVNEVVRVAAPRGGVTSLVSDGVHLYGSAYGSASFEGVFSASWDDGSLRWLADCHGDTHSVFASPPAVYSASHAHNCANIGGFPETSPRTFRRALAFSTHATRTVSPNVYAGYPDFAGLSAPELLVWFPHLDPGVVTGQRQGPWHVTGNGRYVVLGGEFQRVDHRPQQGLVRFAVPTSAPKRQGPKLFGTGWPLRAEVRADGAVELSWSANWDPDDGSLRYRLYRGTTLVHSTHSVSRFWDRATMAYTDTGAARGATHRYRVLATDASGNPAATPWVEVRVPDLPPPPPPPPPTVTVAPTRFSDSFERSVADGWGPPWQLSGRVASRSVSAGTARLGPIAPGAGGSAQVGGVSAVDVVVSARMTVDAPASGGGTYLSLALRRVGRSEYRLTVRHLATTRLQVSLVRVVGGVETVLASSVLPALSMRPLLWLNVRFEAVPAGASSVLSGWVWADGSDSPPAPTLRAVDAAVELGGAGGVGGVGVHAYVSGSAVGPVTVLVDDVNVITR